jgi:hypothetical protein
MSFSFYKKGSNAKIMNNLSFTVVSFNDHVVIKNNRSEIKINLSLDEKEMVNKIKNDTYRSFYTNIILIKNGIEWVFTNTEEKFQKYICIKVKCSSIYAENALKEWMYNWFSTSKIKDEINNLIYTDDLYSIYNHFKKCKITVS